MSMRIPTDPVEWQQVIHPHAPSGATTWRHLTRPLMAIRSYDRIGDDDARWHLSVSHADRIPTWEELGIARDALLPEDMHFVIQHPPRRYWLNLNHRVLHLWESDDEALMAHAEWEGEMAQKAGFGEPA